MQILESIRYNLQIVGMNSYQSIQKHPFNARNSTSLLIYTISIICNIGFLIGGAKSLMEFTDALFLTTTAILSFSIFVNLNWQMRQLFELLNDIENTVDQSEYDLI